MNPTPSEPVDEPDEMAEAMKAMVEANRNGRKELTERTAKLTNALSRGYNDDDFAAVFAEVLDFASEPEEPIPEGFGAVFRGNGEAERPDGSDRGDIDVGRRGGATPQPGS